MRPLSGDTPLQGIRASDGGAPPASQQPTMTFTRPIDESAIDDALQQPLANFMHVTRDPRKHHMQQAGVGTNEPVPNSPPKHVAAQQRDSSSSTAPSVQDIEEHGDDASRSPGSPLLQQKPILAPSSLGASQSITPLMLATSGPASAVSGLSSPRGSVAASLSEETGSQALSMSMELEPETCLSLEGHDRVPQLVMPSIKMPSRRPFTDEGKRIGRLKVLIAGDSGVGKTALIKAIVQTSDTIVHVDPIPSPSSVSGIRSSSRPRVRLGSSGNGNATNHICEIFASTKPLPEWWSDLDDSQVTKRRRSVGGDTILDRNICFIDTPGHTGGSSSMETITHTIRYVESLFELVQANGSTDPDMLNMLGGDGGNQVDAVLYLVKDKLRPADLEYLQLLAPLTNLIPVIAKADTMTMEAIAQSKSQIRSELAEAGIRPFPFKDESAWPYAVSSLAGSDHDIMDASVLMSPDYVQPLIASELSALVEQMFCEDGASWLRHAAAQKYIQWKKSGSFSRPRGLSRSLVMPAGNSLVATGLRTYPQTTRIAEHQQQQERLARIQMANWAANLERSLKKEQAQLEALAQQERANWLLRKMSEEYGQGRLIAAGDADRRTLSLEDKEKSKVSRTRNQQGFSTAAHQDPLGLVEVAANMKTRSWDAVQLLGSLGLLGGLAFWASRQGWCAQAIGWAVESWAALWHNERWS
ncbi:hypothetical protein N0V82_005020 [Gnomoniopsis sp. IMI 355080]|nr:hypothetical protein N0V82_005020 [Gnomoniopsis sp. IMI 355080]